MTRPLIALLTDFGTKDHYVGVMKGVMKRLCPDAEFIDITHHIPPQDVRAAAFALMNNYQYFPEGTVFLVVIDPGVGLQRKPIAVATNQYTFVAPDNGVLSYVLRQEPAHLVVELPPRPVRKMSTTFHGRDVFAPGAARIARGDQLYHIGSVSHEPPSLYPQPGLTTAEDGDILGEVLFIDHFGNIVTSIGEFDWINDDNLSLIPRFDRDIAPQELSTNSHVTINERTIRHIHHTYGDVQRGDLLALIGSSHFLEIAVNQGNAANRLGAKPGDQVTLHFMPPESE